MPFFAALTLLLLSNLSLAQTTRVAGLPPGLKCEAPQARLASVRQIEVKKLDTDSPESTFRMGFQESSVANGVYDISFSDECEGWYALSFDLTLLQALASGSVGAIEGVLEYDDLAEFFGVESNENEHDKTKVTCILNP